MQRLFTVILVLVVVLTDSCGTELKPAPDNHLALSTALSQLDKLEAPAGVNPEQFAALKSALASALRSSGQSRFASAVPSGTGGTVTDLVLSASGGPHLEWTYRNKGDYDQNRQVTISDLSALGANLGKNSASPDWLTKAIASDGDGNGEVNIADITPVGANLLATVTGYELQTTDTPDSEASWQDLEAVGFDSSTMPGSGLRKFSHNFTPSPNSWYRVVPVDGESRGAASPAVQYALGAPDITGVTPQVAPPGAGLTFSATNNGGTPTSWDWDFGGGAAPNTSAVATPSVTAGARGIYHGSLTASNAAGSDTFNFTLQVVELDPPQIEDVQPPGGVVHAEVGFSATLSGGPAASYAWDFGGGASPNTATADVPVITLGGIGSYPASLTVSNAAGSDTYEFTLSITEFPNNPPTASFTATPMDGYPGDEVKLDASASTDTDGTIAKYAWDLDGDGAYETDTGSNPVLEAPRQNQTGAVVVSLRATDNGGATALAQRTLNNTQAAWHTVSAYFADGGIVAPPILVDNSGLPGIVFREFNTFKYAYTTTDDGGSGFNVVNVVEELSEKDGVSAIAVGTPALAYFSTIEQALKYAYSTTSDGNGPWEVVTVENFNPAGFGHSRKVSSLAVVNSTPVIAYDRYFAPGDVDQLVFAHAKYRDDEWIWVPADVDTSNSLGASVASINGFPGIAYTTATSPETRQLRYAYSTSSLGDSGWHSVTLTGDVGADWTELTLREVAGYPAILFGLDGSGGFDFASSTVWNGSSDWSTHHTGLTYSTLPELQSLAFAHYPYAALMQGDHAGVAMVSVNAQPDGGGEWADTGLKADSVEGGVTMAVIGGRPAAAYKVHKLGWPEFVMYAIYK